jgi:hypothetical protein
MEFHTIRFRQGMTGQYNTEGYEGHVSRELALYYESILAPVKMAMKFSY